MVHFIVITKVPKWDGKPDTDEPWNDSCGNLADALLVLMKDGTLWDVSNHIEGLDCEIVRCKQEVFQPGEILVVYDGGREVGGRGRKPSKWFVEYEEFTDVEKAAARSIEVIEASNGS